VGPIDDEERLGNAKLISKAPEMYEALKWLMDCHNEDVLNIASTEMHANYNDEVVNNKLIEIESLLKEIEL
jgi:hypothetical protein